MAGADGRKDGSGRKVPLKVMVLGLGRTGTASTREALLNLGYSEVYHYFTWWAEHINDSDMWMRAVEAKFEGRGAQFSRRDWDELLGKCMAITDFPCVAFSKELIEAYPEVKVILTVRDTPEQWHYSQMKTVTPENTKYSLPPKTIYERFYRQFQPPPGPVGRVSRKILKHYDMYQILAEDMRHGTKNGIQCYLDHNEEIRSLVPEDRLLIFNVKEGWEPLCKFLGDEAPQHEEFPRKNTMSDWFEMMSSIGQKVDRYVYWNAAKTLSPVLVGALCLGSYLVYRFR